MKIKLNTGDVVQLKSGGPEMTIIGYSNLQQGHICRWFVGNESKQEVFPSEALKSVERK